MITVILLFFILLVSTYTDIKTREVPDWISYAGITSGLGMRLLLSIEAGHYGLLIRGVEGFALCAAIGLTLFYLGQWGGGDSKLLMAVGAVIGLRFNLDSPLVAFLANLTIIGGMYGFIWTSAVGIGEYSKVKQQIRKEYKAPLVGIIQGGLAILGLLMAITVSILFEEVALQALGILAALAIPSSFALYVIFGSIEKVCLIKNVAPDKLTEGDWIAEDIKHKGKLLCGPSDLGIEKEQIALLKKYKIKQVLIKVGMPFVPAFLVAYTITVMYGSLLRLFGF
jgi:Flp pilus assembly protein protease CpaA